MNSVYGLFSKSRIELPELEDLARCDIARSIYTEILWISDRFITVTIILHYSILYIEDGDSSVVISTAPNDQSAIMLGGFFFGLKFIFPAQKGRERHSTMIQDKRVRLKPKENDMETEQHPRQTPRHGPLQSTLMAREGDDGPRGNSFRITVPRAAAER